jgi:hypothetical protein
MTIDLNAAFESDDDEFLKFERVANKKSTRPDLHAFILLNELVPGETDIVSAAEHDEIFLSIDCEELAKVVTLEQVIELSRCGVRYHDEYDCLCMFA